MNNSTFENKQGKRSSSRVIKLTRGFEAIVDARDYRFLSRFKWFASMGGGKTPYACRRFRSKHLRMHRVVLGLDDDSKTVDHANRNTLDNRRCNLRICTVADNIHNRGTKPGRWGFKGIDYRDGKFRARVKLNYKSHVSGLFDTAIEAAMEYDRMVRELHGEFASPNFPEKK